MYLVSTSPISFSFSYMKAVSISLTPASRDHSMAFSISPGALCQHPKPTEGISTVWRPNFLESVVMFDISCCFVCPWGYCKLNWTVSVLDYTSLLYYLTLSAGLKQWEITNSFQAGQGIFTGRGRTAAKVNRMNSVCSQRFAEGRKKGFFIKEILRNVSNIV